MLLISASHGAISQSFPLDIDHQFGTSTIEAKPDRVATLDFVGADDLLALGVQPVVIRRWYGDFSRAVWPWADARLDSQPVIIERAIDIESVAAARPDVILAMWSGMTESEYAQLSQIAPVIARPRGMAEFAISWDERAILTGRATGHEADARAEVEEVRRAFADLREKHPEWQGKSAAILYLWNDQLGLFGPEDIRTQILAMLGLTPPEIVRQTVPQGAFFAAISDEVLPQIDADVALWFASADDFDEVRRLPTRRFMPASQNGAEIFVDTLLEGALSHGTLLSLPYALERLVPALDQALAGSPVDLSEEAIPGVERGDQK